MSSLNFLFLSHFFSKSSLFPSSAKRQNSVYQLLVTSINHVSKEATTLYIHTVLTRISDLFQATLITGILDPSPYINFNRSA
jgi:hypothetical protein